MRRRLALLDYALGALRRRLGRNLAITVGLALVVGLFSSVLFVTDALRREFALGVESSPDVTLQRLEGGRPALVPVDTLASLASRRGVERVEPRLFGYLFLSSLEANLTVVAYRPHVDADTLVEGHMPRAPGQMALGAEIAERLGLRVGDEMALPRPGGFHLLAVVGIFHGDSALRSADLLLTTDEDARIILGIPPGLASDIAVYLSQPEESAVVAALAAEAIEGARVLERRLSRRTYELTFDARGGLLAAMGVPALIALLLLAWERLTGLSEAERREIGVLKAIGWETSDVLTARLLESGLVALVGTGTGVAVAYAFVFYLGAPLLSDALFGWSALYPPFELTPAVDAAEILTILGAIVIPYGAISLLPAFRAASLDPDEAIRGGR